MTHLHAIDIISTPRQHTVGGKLRITFQELNIIFQKESNTLKHCLIIYERSFTKEKI